MSFYDINYNDRSTELLSPRKRKPIILAWVYILVYPLQYLRDMFYGDYKTGAVYSDWTNGVVYAKYTRITWKNKSIYEAVLSGTAVALINEPTGTIFSSMYWRKVQDIFIGVDDRIKFNSQLSVFEYALNTYFRVGTGSPQIFINNNVPNNSVFVMGKTGPYSSVMSNSSVFATTYMANSPSFSTYVGNFTINVPTALFTTLGATAADREKVVRQFADKYKLAGLKYNVVTF